MKLHDQFTETVGGIIIDDDIIRRRVALVSPNGRVQREATTDQPPKQWAESEKAKLLSQKCGDGKPLSNHATNYRNGQWSVRIWD
jgi:hypothetical protein